MPERTAGAVVDAVTSEVTDRPDVERQRLAAVRRLAVLDTPPDGTFDRITAIAARLFSVPIAIVSVVDEHRIWFKSHHGLDVSEIDRTPGLCASAILSTELYVLTDALTDPIALSNPLVAGEFGLRFYAAAPLTTSDGFNLGTLCVIDHEPRDVTAEEMATLKDLAEVVVSQLELRLDARNVVADARLDQERAEGLAAALRSALLPGRMPKVPGLDIAATFRPTDEADVGGDFYDVFPISRRSWGIALGDVCGKGPRAAAISGAARYAVRAAGIEHASPSRVLEVLNDTLLLDAETADSRFCTIVYGHLRPHGASAFQLTIASGGHPLPLVLRAGGRIETLGDHGTLVGILRETSFRDRSTRLRIGDVVVFFTDGITEARTEVDLFGDTGIIDILKTCVGRSAAEIATTIDEAATTSGTSQRDDVAILVVKVTGPNDLIPNGGEAAASAR